MNYGSDSYKWFLLSSTFLNNVACESIRFFSAQVSSFIRREKSFSAGETRNLSRKYRMLSQAINNGALKCSSYSVWSMNGQQRSFSTRTHLIGGIQKEKWAPHSKTKTALNRIPRILQKYLYRILLVLANHLFYLVFDSPCWNFIAPKTWTEAQSLGDLFNRCLSKISYVYFLSYSVSRCWFLLNILQTTWWARVCGLEQPLVMCLLWCSTCRSERKEIHNLC